MLDTHARAKDRRDLLLTVSELAAPQSKRDRICNLKSWISWYSQVPNYAILRGFLDYATGLCQPTMGTICDDSTNDYDYGIALLSVQKDPLKSVLKSEKYALASLTREKLH